MIPHVPLRPHHAVFPARARAALDPIRAPDVIAKGDLIIRHASTRCDAQVKLTLTRLPAKMIERTIERFTMHVQSNSARRTFARLALSGADWKRLERLAAAAGSTPQRMLKFVLRDGFAYCEEFVRRVNAGIASARRGEIMSDSEARAELRAMAARHGRRSRKAA